MLSLAQSTSLWLSFCNSTSPCCSAWRAKVEKSAHIREEELKSEPSYETRFPPTYQNGGATIHHLDMFEPEWSCEARERVPTAFGDGPKWACGIDTLKRHKRCLVYSIGSNGDLSFESGVKARAPGCEIYTFDPTLSAAGVAKLRDAERSGLLRFVDVGVAAEDGNFTFLQKSFPALSLASIQKKLGHMGRVVDVFKIDVEGSEHEVFARLSEAQISRMGQLLIELHYVGSGTFERKHGSRLQVKDLVNRVRGSGLKLFSKEPNVWGCRGYTCGEFSFVGPQHAFRAFQATHPVCAHAKAPGRATP